MIILKQTNFKSKLNGIVYTVNFRLRTRITIISDTSGTGKTLVRKLAAKDCEEVISFSSSELNLIKALLETETHRFNFKDKVIIIDNAEKLLREVPELINCINYDRNNYYIVFLRQTSIPIEATPNSQARLSFDNASSTFNIKYTYEDGMWA